MKEILERIWLDLEQGVINGKHPFRTFVIANSEGENKLRQRTVVLRKVESMSTLTFYTDSRSGKVKELNVQDQVSILFYDTERRVQLSCQGIAIIDASLPKELNSRDPRTLKDYTTVLPPGSPVEDSGSVQYDDGQINFATVTVTLTSVEYLELSRNGHTRIRFEKEGYDNQQNGTWVGQYLVP